MDLDAEMRKLQEEARREIASRDAADAEDPPLPPTPIPERVKRKAPPPQPAAPQPAATKTNEANILDRASAALNAAKAANDLAQQFDPEVIAEAKQLAEKATDVEKMSLLSKLAWGAGGLLAFLIVWKLVLEPIVLGIVGLAVIVLIVVGVLKLMGFGKDKGDEDDPEA